MREQEGPVATLVCGLKTVMCVVNTVCQIQLGYFPFL